VEAAMYYPEKGVLKHSNTYFPTPSNLAKTLFFHLIATGEFFCTGDYLVRRTTFHSYLIIYVRSGSGEVGFEGKTYTATANDVIFLNCHKPHLYRSTPDWEILFIHFDGNSSRQIFELLYEKYGVVLPLGKSVVVQHYLAMIVDAFKAAKPLPEPIVSSYIHRVLSELLLHSSFCDPEKKRTAMIMDALTYVETNYRGRLSLAMLAAQSNMSPYHFSRIFKLETGFSPYEYIIKTRIDVAKILLKQTGRSVKEIAYEVGFASESHFSKMFLKSVNHTPSEFRKTSY
jgi:AraC-like DNA-binding protein